MRRLSDLLPEAVAALGIADELVAATRGRSWDAVVAEVVPAAVGRCELAEVRPPELVVRAADAATAQELRLHGSALLAALGEEPGTAGVTELRVVVGRDRPEGVESFTKR
jgi:hypothetical protein